MKHIFTKYIPVTGKIKEGDVYWNPRREMHFTAELGNDFKTLNTKYRIRGAKAYQKVKLMFCSRDIHVGDSVIELVGTPVERKFVVTVVYQDKDMDGNDITMVGDDGEAINLGNVLKVLGEVWAEDSWVKEGMFFNEEDLLAQGVGVSWDRTGYHKSKFKIKCSNCNQFH